MLTDEQVVEQRDDGEMMRRPNLWPARPFLPLRRYDDPDLFADRNFGLLTEGRRSVLLTNLFCFDPEAERIDYESVEAILADGWRVD